MNALKKVFTDSQPCITAILAGSDLPNFTAPSSGVKWLQTELCSNPATVLAGMEGVEEKVIYGVESNSTFLECVPRSQQTEVRWTMQQQQDPTSREVRRGQ